MRTFNGRFRSIRWATIVALLVLPVAAHAQTAPEPLVGKIVDVGSPSFEPTIGVDGAGRVYFSVTRDGVAIGWRPGTFMSEDHGNTWKDISPSVAGVTLPPETNDPFIYVDPTTGRIYQMHMAPILTCATMSYSDDQGATWFTNPIGCGGAFPYDHQTIVASHPRALPTTGYPNILLQCVNSIHSETCTRSLDGGRSWLPSMIAYPNSRLADGALVGTQTGHLASAPDGTIYLPTSEGGKQPVVYVSKDDGLTWTRRPISPQPIPFTDPAIAVDSLGNLYAAYVDGTGNLFYTVSRNEGVTWSTPVRFATGITASLPALDVGDPGKVVVAFPGTTDLPQGFATASGKYACGKDTHCVGWNAYLAVSYDALDANPTFQAVKTNQDGPLFRNSDACLSGGRCSYLTDFIDVTVGPDGRPYAAFSRGCTGSCLTNPKADNNIAGTGLGTLATLASGPSLCSTGCASRFALPAGG